MEPEFQRCPICGAPPHEPCQAKSEGQMAACPRAPWALSQVIAADYARRMADQTQTHLE